MRNENKNQKRQEPVKQKKKRIYREEDPFTPKTDDTSMSSGNLVNNPIERTRTKRTAYKNICYR